jgi:hypothetical protein
MSQAVVTSERIDASGIVVARLMCMNSELLKTFLVRWQRIIVP